MIGRDREVAEVEALLDGAARGISGALLVSGEPGIGKTALLGRARDGARPAQLLEMTGVEAESHLAFAGLSDLLAPILGHLDELPGPQAAALRGALALGPPVPGDRFTAYAGAFGLLAAAAERGPVVCVVDDAHWLDAESLEALVFTARRLGAEGIALLLGARDDASELVEASGLERLRLRGLEPADAVRLLVERAGADPEDATAALLVAGAAGNPLAVIELAEGLSPDQLAGREPLPDPLPVGPHLARGLLRPLEALPESTRRALLIASADDGAGDLLDAALAASGLEPGDLAPAERAGVLRPDAGGRTFRHPLLRGAVYGAAEAPDRRAAHRALAEACADDPGAADRGAWHLALSVAGPDEGVATALEQAAARAAARTAYSAATEALEVAARMSPDPLDRGRRLLAAGQTAVAAGAFDRAAITLDEVVSIATDPAQVIQAMSARAFVETFGGSSRRAVTMFLAATDRAASAGGGGVAAMLALNAAVPAVMRADLDTAVAALDQAKRNAGDLDEASALLVDAASATLSTFEGVPTPVSAPVFAGLAEAASRGDPAGFAWLIAGLHCLMMMERYDEAASGLDAIIESARARSTPSPLPWPLAVRAEVWLRVGRLDEAAAAAAESVRLADETGQAGMAGYARSTLAQVDAVLGRADDCRAHAAHAVAATVTSEADSLRTYAGAALGLLALSMRDLPGAFAHFSSIDRDLRRRLRRFHPLISTWEHDLAETLVRMGRTDEAGVVLARLEERGERSGAAWTAAVVARCRGLGATDDFEEHFDAALTAHARTTTPLERARTLLCLGERRRRARRHREAREVLEEARGEFEAVGAVSWAAWARHELAAAGGASEIPPLSIAHVLTPQELQVALTLAEGGTIREAASALLISPKTVESHLGHVYAKLGIHTRAELASRMAAGD